MSVATGKTHVEFRNNEYLNSVIIAAGIRIWM